MSEHATSTKNRRAFLRAAGSAVGLAALAGCGEGSAPGDGGGGGSPGEGGGGGSTGDGDAAEDPIVIAALEPQSGPFSEYGPRHLRGAEFAAREINGDGGVNGREVEIVSVDTESDPQRTVDSFAGFVEQDGAVAGIGPVSSDAAIRTADFAEENEVPLLLHAAGASTVLSMESRYTFRTALPAVPTCVKAIGEIIEAEGYTEVAYVVEDGAWGREFQVCVEAYWPDDVDVTADEAPTGETDFIPYLWQFPDDVEAVVGTAHPAGITSMYPQMLELEVEPELFVGAITDQEVDHAAVGDEIDEGFVSFNSPDLYSEEFAEVGQAYYDEEGDLFDTSQANGYVAVDLIVQAIAEAGESGHAEIAAALHEGTFDTLYANPVNYTEWGEPNDHVIVWNGFDVGSAPEYYPEGEFAPEEFLRSDPLPAFEPGELGLQ